MGAVAVVDTAPLTEDMIADANNVFNLGPWFCYILLNIKLRNMIKFTWIYLSNSTIIDYNN